MGGQFARHGGQGVRRQGVIVIQEGDVIERGARQGGVAGGADAGAGGQPDDIDAGIGGGGAVQDGGDLGGG